MAYGRHQHRAAMVRRAALVVVPATIALFGATAAVGAPPGESVPANAPGGPVPTGAAPGSAPAISSQPPDRQTYAQPAGPGDRLASPALPAGYVLVDPVVSNTDPNLKNFDGFPDSEPSLAINGANSNEIVITGFSSSWIGNGNASVFRSTNGGSTWTKAFSIPPPTGVARSGCPCDQVIDFDRSQRFLGTFLNEAANSGDVYTGSTTNAGSAAAWRWATKPNGVAKKTDNPGTNNADQPWLRVTRDPFTATQDNAYVGWDDFSTAQLKVSVSRGANPPSVVATRVIGGFGCCVNPGTRLAPDHRNGTVYALYQHGAGINSNGSVRILYALNRSTDGGNTWSLNGSATGIIAAGGDSNQPTPKFGTVNALLGGVDAVGVDNTNGYVYVVYGYRDAQTGNNRLAIVRFVRNSSGQLVGVSNKFLTGQIQTALPAVAVAANGTVGVLYDKFNGFNASGFPVFSAHLAQSTDKGLTFSDVKLLAFASPAKDNGDPRQRVLGDYQSLRSLGNTFYGTFTANGAQFGRTTSNTDAIFFKAPAK